MELSGRTRNRLASAKAMMKLNTRIAASRSQRLGSSRRASIETGGRIFMSGRPSKWDTVKSPVPSGKRGDREISAGRVAKLLSSYARIGGFAASGNHFEVSAA